MGKPLHLLLVEDSEHDALLLHQLQRGGFDVDSQRVETETQLRLALQERPWDLVIGDYHLRDFSGLAALAVVKAHDPDLPFLLISGARGEEFAVEAMQAGAGDYLIKGQLARLAPAVERELQARQQRQARRQADAALDSRNRRLRLLAQLAERLLAAAAPVDAATAAYRMIAEELDLHAYFNFLLEADGDLRLDSWAGIPDQAARLITRLKVGEAVCGRVAESGEPWHVTEVQSSADPRFKLIRRYGLRAYYCSPLQVGERLLGTLSFGTRSRDRFSDGEIEFIRTVVRYVALADERLRAEKALRESEERFRAFFENAAVGAMEMGLDGRFLQVNERFCRLIGYTREALLKVTPHDLAHPADRPRQEEGFRQLLAGERTFFEMEKRYCRQDGSPIWVQETTGAIHSPEGKLQRLVGIVQDISGRKQSEVERERLLAELDATLQAMANGVVVYSAVGEIRRLNPAADQMLCYSPQVKVRPMLERKAALYPQRPDGTPYPLEEHPAWRALKGETTLSEVMLYHPCGAERPLWVAVSAAPIRTPDGEILGAVSTLTDLSPLRELQNEREIYLHTISHDLRTPLSVVLGHAELLGLSCRQEEAQMHVEAILQGVERMDRMIEELVEAARLEGGEISLEKEPVPLDRFLADFLQQGAPVLDASRISLSVAPALPPVMADRRRLERILTNLLTNALKYSPPEAPVEVAVRPEGREVLVSVRDQGEGILPEDLPHIFRRFYRSRRGRKANSVGLGLYITRSLIEAHGGRIWVNSEPGEGSIFTFCLPAADPK